MRFFPIFLAQEGHQRAVIHHVIQGVKSGSRWALKGERNQAVRIFYYVRRIPADLPHLQILRIEEQNQLE